MAKRSKKRPKKSKGRKRGKKQLKVFLDIKGRHLEVLPGKVFSKASGIPKAELNKLLKMRGFPCHDIHGQVWIEVGAAAGWIDSEMRQGRPVKGWGDSLIRRAHVVGPLYTRSQDEAEQVRHAMKLTFGNRTKAAELLNVHRNTVRNLIKKHDIWDWT